MEKSKQKAPQEATEQADRFRETARQLGADESDDALHRAMGKLNLKAKPEQKERRDGVGK